MKAIYCLPATIALTFAAVLNVAASESVRFKITPEHEFISNRKDTEVTLKLSLEGLECKSERRTPVNLAIVLDRSGSMRGAKLEKARQAAGIVLEQLGRNDVFSLVTYHTRAAVLIPPQHVRNAARLNRKIESIHSGGSTALYAGVKLGARQLKEFFDEENINRVILLSDGLANVGPRTPDALAKLGTRLANDGIHVSTIGLGDDYNEDLMVALAEASAANYYYVKDAEKLPGIFEEELGYIRNILARNIEIVIDLPEDVVGIEVLGHPEIKFRGNRAAITLSELYALQTRDFLVRCRITESGDRDLKVAAIQLAYRDEQSGKQQQSESSVSVKRTGDRKRVGESQNREVSEQIAVTNNVVAREQALKLADEGRNEEAAAALRRQAGVNAAAGKQYGNEMLKDEADALEDAARQLESEGEFSPGARKAFQYKSYEQKKQR
jgi:Ca-activated chloride channel family protein